METHPCTEICSKKEATAKNIFRFLEIRKLTYENKMRETFKLIIWKWKVKFKLHLFTILLSCRFSSKFILKLRDPQSFSDTDS